MADKTKFTKGEWVVDKDDSFWHVTCGDWCVVTSFDQGQDIANAHLIAVAPEMYEMLNVIMEDICADRMADISRCMQAGDIRGLLRKARGE